MKVTQKRFNELKTPKEPSLFSVMPTTKFEVELSYEELCEDYFTYETTSGNYTFCTAVLEQC